MRKFCSGPKGGRNAEKYQISVLELMLGEEILSSN